MVERSPTFVIDAAFVVGKALGFREALVFGNALITGTAIVIGVQPHSTDYPAVETQITACGVTADQRFHGILLPERVDETVDLQDAVVFGDRQSIQGLVGMSSQHGLQLCSR